MREQYVLDSSQLGVCFFVWSLVEIAKVFQAIQICASFYQNSAYLGLYHTMYRLFVFHNYPTVYIFNESSFYFSVDCS